MEPERMQHIGKIESKLRKGGPGGVWVRCGLRSPFWEPFWRHFGGQGRTNGGQMGAKGGSNGNENRVKFWSRFGSAFWRAPPGRNVLTAVKPMFSLVPLGCQKVAWGVQMEPNLEQSIRDAIWSGFLAIWESKRQTKIQRSAAGAEPIWRVLGGFQLVVQHASLPRSPGAAD